MAGADNLLAYFDLADQFFAGSSKEDVAEAARLLALNVAHSQVKYGALPVENFADVVRAETIQPGDCRAPVGGFAGKRLPETATQQ